jgi:hypothetical protein
MDLAGKIDVVGVTTLAAQQRRVFLARHRLADTEFHQRKVGVVERVHGNFLRTHDVIAGGVTSALKRSEGSNGVKGDEILRYAQDDSYAVT